MQRWIFCAVGHLRDLHQTNQENVLGVWWYSMVDGRLLFKCVCVWVCMCVCMYLNITAGRNGWLADFFNFLEGKVACTVASGDCSSETEEHIKSINPCCYYLSTLWNPKRRSHIYKCSQHVVCAVSSCITNVCASSFIKESVILMWLGVSDKICSNVSDKHAKLPPIVVLH